MRSLVIITLAILASACFAQLAGGYKKIDLSNPPSDFNKAVSYVKTHFHSSCKLNSSVQISQVEQAFVQVVAGKNYKIVFTADNYQNETLTAIVFVSLPDQNGKVKHTINSCI